MRPTFIIHLQFSRFSVRRTNSFLARVTEIYRRHLLIYNEKLVALGPQASALAAQPRPLYDDGMSDTRLEPRALPTLGEVAAPCNRTHTH